MRVLLLHPDDGSHGSWAKQRWDSIVDLGRAPNSFYQEISARLGCPVFSISELAVEVEDFQTLREMFALGMGLVVDRFGIDWWDVISLMLQPELQDVRLAMRLAERLTGCRTLAVSRRSTTAEVVALHLGVPLQVLDRGYGKRLASELLRRGRAVANLGFVQARQVVYDKYDPHYRWRRKIAESPNSKTSRPSEPLVLLPSAYSNVTKTAFYYAGLLPEQKFLLVLARESGAVLPIPSNVRSIRLASFASGKWDRSELEKLKASWERMQRSLNEHPALRLSTQTGIMKRGAYWLRWGLVVRDAWLRVFETQSVVSCLCADDSNPYTRIPLLLAEQRSIPAVACHHGALDCRMAFKNRRFSKYLAKSQMESDYLQSTCGVAADRIVMGGSSSRSKKIASVWRENAPWISFFTEPYEADFWRADAIFREVLPRLCAVARRAGKTVVLKLHPFESVRQRTRLMNRVLNEADRKLVSLTDAPLSTEILSKTWCAVTVESTVAFECATVGIPTLLCGWLRHAYAGYGGQYVRFGAGRMLDSPDDLLRIPDFVAAFTPDSNLTDTPLRPVTSKMLSDVLCPTAERCSP
ncbi:MAG: hypothetical protein ABSD53_01035 [Terriglobales bacterium]|jgi:hypothetical protein